MKTRELIKQLQELDPTGECEVFGGDGDIYFLEKLPWYYDGRPGILIRDETRKPYYDVIGMRQITEKDGDKIYIHCLGIDDVFGENDKDDLVCEGDEYFKERARKARQEYIEMITEMIKGDFFKFFRGKFPNAAPGKAEVLWNCFSDIIERHDFNSLGSSQHAKRLHYWNDLFVEVNGEIVVRKEFYKKDYNNPMV